MKHTENDPFVRALARAAERQLPRYVRLLTKRLRRLPTNAELATLRLNVTEDARPAPKRRRE